jgi:hypothetical protein
MKAPTAITMMTGRPQFSPASFGRSSRWRVPAEQPGQKKSRTLSRASGPIEVTTMNNNTVFAQAIGKGIFDDGSPAPDHSVSRRSPRLPEDICSNKHGGNLASNLAYERMKYGHNEIYEEIRALFRQHGTLTSKQIEELTGWKTNHFAPRLTELRLVHYEIMRTGRLIDGAYVLKLVDE